MVVRRALSGLREAGLVSSGKGHRGGWTLSRNPKLITLFDVYAALGEPVLFNLEEGRESSTCLFERAVAKALNSEFGKAKELLLARLKSVTLADLSAEFRRYAAQLDKHGEGAHHAP